MVLSDPVQCIFEAFSYAILKFKMCNLNDNDNNNNNNSLLAIKLCWLNSFCNLCENGIDKIPN